MKYAAFVFLSFFLLSSLQARTIFSFKQSNAIVSVANMLSDNAEDLKVSFRISDSYNVIKDVSKCEQVESSVALLAFKDAMDSVMRLFPDEEMPYNEALADMNNYLDMEPLTLCKFFHAGEESQTVTLYFFDLRSRIQLRIDKTTKL